MEIWFNEHTGTITVISLIIAMLSLIVAYLAFKDQKNTKFQLEAEPMVASNNNRYFGIETLMFPNLKISNFGTKAITIVNISLCVGKKKFPIPQWSNHKINIYIEPGKTEYFQYERDWAIEMVTNNKFPKDYIVCWEATTNEGKRAKCKSNNRVSDFLNVKKENDYVKA